MSDWQKVRIQFTDASGEEVSVVMWAPPEFRYAAYQSDNQDDVGLTLIWGEDSGVKMDAIRELPTGLGAVVKVVKPQFNKGRDLYIHTGNGWWCNNEGNDISAHSDHSGFDELEWPYEILSEGIEL